MELLSDWVKKIASYLIFTTALNNLVHKKEYVKYIRLISGILLIFILIEPVLEMFGQMDIYRFQLEKYLTLEEINNSYSISNAEEKKEEMLMNGIEAKVSEQVRSAALAYNLTLTECMAQISKEADSYGKIQYMKIKLESSDDVIYDSEFESPNIILLRNDIAKMFGMNQETIEITIY